MTSTCCEYYYKAFFDFYICERLQNFKPNTKVLILAGLLFFSGWWLMIDVNCHDRKLFDNNKEYYVPAILGTLALTLVSLIPNSTVDEFDENDGHVARGTLGLLLMLWLGFCLAFGCLIAAFYIWIALFLMDQDKPQYPGVIIVLHNVMIFAVIILIKFFKQKIDVTPATVIENDARAPYIKPKFNVTSIKTVEPEIKGPEIKTTKKLRQEHGQLTAT